MRSAKKRQQQITPHWESLPEPYFTSVEDASENDRHWFETHLDATYRLRPYIAGEFRDTVPPTNYRVYVEQLRPGIRVRQLLSPTLLQQLTSQGSLQKQISQTLHTTFSRLEQPKPPHPYPPPKPSSTFQLSPSTTVFDFDGQT